MARVSRKAALRKQDAPVAAPSERIYNTAIYVRLSVEDNNRSTDNDSLAMQRYMMEKFVNTQPDMRLCAVFTDNGETGTNFERPGFESLMDEIRSRKIDCIVVKDLSRFGRNYIEAGYYLEKIFPFLGVRFIAVNDNFDSAKANSGDELVISLKNLVNDLYARDISKKILSSLSTKQQNGEFIGAFPPYGYLKSEDDHHKLVIDPATAPIVREIFEWRLNEEGIVQIARRLNERKIPSPSMYHYLNGRRKKKPEGAGAVWQAQMVKKITSNPVYAGHMAQGKCRKSLYMGLPKKPVDKDDWIVVPNTHEAIISQDIFDRVQDIAQQRHDYFCAIRGKYETTENILKGVLVCGDCGTKMTRYKSVSPAGTARYVFICRVYSENLSGQGCTQKSVGEPELKEYILQTLRVQVELAVTLEKLLIKLQKQPDFQSKRKTVLDKITRLEQKIKRCASLKSSLFESYSDHTLTEQEYLSMKQEYDEQTENYNAELAQLEQERLIYMKTLTPQNEWIMALKKYEGEKTVTRKMVDELIHHIVVTDYNTIEIVWNFEDEFARLAEQAKGAHN